MDHPNRRGFLALAGAGAAVAGAVAVAPSAQASTPSTVPAHVTEPLVAYVRDAHTGEIAVMTGEREIIVHDTELAARIARAAG